MEKPKRSRSANWDLQEKLLLKECIKEYINIIESKSCDTNMNKKKQEAWMQVLRRFNELNLNERGLIEIKQQWRSAKLEAKKCVSLYKKALRQTGGGQKPPSPPPDVTLEAGSSRQTDHNYIKQTQDKIWPDETNNITLERQPGASKRKCSKFKVTNFGKNNEERKSRDMVLIECLREEHKLKVKQMTEAHQWAKKEHELKIQHLKLQITILENEVKDINT